MSITFNAAEILEMAEEIERNGAKFYRKAAESIDDKKTHQFLLDLAVMEDHHEKIFKEMKNKLSDTEQRPVTFDPDNEAVLYLRVMADNHVFDIKADSSQKLTGNETPEDIFSMALKADRDSIAFYVGLKAFVPAEIGKDKVEEIIAEEMVHIVTINQKMNELKQ